MAKKTNSCQVSFDDPAWFALTRFAEEDHRDVPNFIAHVVLLHLQQKIAAERAEVAGNQVPLGPTKSPPHHIPSSRVDEMALIRAQQSREHESKPLWSGLIGSGFADTEQPT